MLYCHATFIVYLRSQSAGFASPMHLMESLLVMEQLESLEARSVVVLQPLAQRRCSDALWHASLKRQAQLFYYNYSIMSVSSFRGTSSLIPSPLQLRGLPVTRVVSCMLLQEILSRAVSDDAIMNDCNVVDFIDDGDKVSAILEDGRKFEDDLLVGADGIQSKVRKSLFEQTEASYSEYTSYTGIADFVPPDIDTAGYRVFLGHKQYFVSSDVGVGKTQWQKEKIARVTSGWCDNVIDLLNATNKEAILRRDIYDRPPTINWDKGCVTLLGDSVYAMQPNLSQGGCMAIEVLHMDRNDYYGGDSTSLNLNQFMMANGTLVRTLIHTDVTKYLSFKAVDGSFVFSKGKFYSESLARFQGGSPYIYPLYGLGELPQGFARLSAVYGGTYMLSKPECKVEFDMEGKACGVTSEGETAKCKKVVCDPSYLSNKVRKIGKVARAIAIMSHPIPNTNESHSVQIILPQKELGRKSDMYVFGCSYTHNVAPKGKFIAFVSAEAESENIQSELKPGIDLLGPVDELFFDMYDRYEPVNEPSLDNCFISTSYDATTHFETTVTDVLNMYTMITGKAVDLSVDLSAASAAEEEY
ncbi:hypothetical protein ACQ4PT_058359 [Festuca glaucescens]